MKQIQLTKSKIAFIDDSDFESISSFKWCFHPAGYAVRRKSGGGIIWMHREIICAPDGIQVDHSNLDRLDNRRENLRLTLHRGNSANRPKRSGKYSSTFKGVHLDKRRGKWIVSVGKKFCGYFNSEIDAAKIYDQKSKEIFGEFSRPNNYQEEKPNV